MPGADDDDRDEGTIVTPKTIKTQDTFAENLEQTQESAQKPTVVPRSDLTKVHDLANRLVGNDRRRTMRIRERLAFAG